MYASGPHPEQIEDPTMILGLIQNIALLVAIGYICDFFWKKEQNTQTLFERIIAGLLLGGIGIVIMMTPWVLVPGIVFDVRSVMLAGAGLFFGGIPTLIAMSITILYRYSLGGDGVWMGMAVILVSGSIGLFWRALRPPWKSTRLFLDLVILGLLVHVAMLACVGLIPVERAIHTFESIVIPTLVIYPIGFVMYGYFLSSRIRYWQTRRDLVRSEERFREIIENSRDIHYRQNYETWEIEYMSPSVERVLGYTSEEVCAMSIEQHREWFHPNDLALFAEFKSDLLAARKEKGFIELEFRMFHRNGDLRWIHGHYTVQDGRHGEPVAVLGLLRDITESREQQNALRKSLTEIERITTNSPNVIWKTSLTTEGQFFDSYISPGMDDLLGLPTGSISNDLMNFFQYIHPRDRERVHQTVLESIETPGKTVNAEYEVRRGDGKSVWLLSSGRVYDEDGVLTSYGYTVDITERREANIVIQRSERRFRSYVESAPDGIFITNGNGTITEMNEAAIRLMGASREQLLGKSLDEMIANRDMENALNAHKNLIENGHYSGEILFERADGNFFYSLLDAVRIDEDQILFFVKNIDDIMRTQEELRAAKEMAEESDRLKSTFLASMSHELRTPLNAIIGFSDLFEPEMSSVDIMRYAQIINDSGKHLLSIIESIFDIALLQSHEARIEPVQFSTGELFAQVSEYLAVEIRKQGKEHLFTTLRSDGDMLLETDRTRVIQVLRNLLSNAVKFTASGSIEYGCHAEGEDITFFVRDTGIGIPRDKHNLVFEQFQQVDNQFNRTHGGVGLGLAICREIATLLNAELHLDSEDGAGTTVSFRIPGIVRGLATPPPPSARPTYPDFHGDTVLLVDDVAENLAFLVFLVQRTGAEILRATSGEEAVECVHRHPEISLVLMDIKMPGMNGYEATRAIHAVRPDLPIIAQTAFALGGDAEKARDAGCIDHVTKPIRRDDLLRKMGRVLGREL